MNTYKTIEYPEGKFVRVWDKYVDIEPQCFGLIGKAMCIPVVKAMAQMPDTHFGKGCNVGSVVLTEGGVVPSFVGVDAGCGMMAVKLGNVNGDDIRENQDFLYDMVLETIPVGSSRWNPTYDDVDWIRKMYWKDSGLVDGFEKILSDGIFEYKGEDTWEYLGSLGGGNHFIEICTDENDDVWVMLHSGCRGIGYKVAASYVQEAKKACGVWCKACGITLPLQDLAFFPENTSEFDSYMHAVQWCQNFALNNRKVLLKVTLDTLSGYFGMPIVKADEEINCHHNYISKENHLGRNMYVTRKGAIMARNGVMGIIPGDMTNRSFIVRGKGSDASFHSCSHGAGRTMSRTDAKKKITLEDHKKNTKSIACKKKGNSILEESRGAYKDLDAVMESQNDLVEKVHTLQQHVCIKG